MEPHQPHEQQEPSPLPEKADGRRAHRKSKKGCLVCKRRRVKCDERRPVCGNCAIGDRPCSYQQDVKPQHQNTSSPGARLSPSVGSTHSAPAGLSSSCLSSFPFFSNRLGAASAPASVGSGDAGADGAADAMIRASRSAPSFSAVHMVLLHHAESHFDDEIAMAGAVRPFLDAVIDSATTDPYLLDQLLALSALHLAHLHNMKASKNSNDASRDGSRANGYAMTSFYRYEATKLQTRALGLFNQVREDISERHYIPSFLFASLLGLHVLHTTLSDINPHQGGLGDFVSAFVSYARLHRGVRTVASKHWPELKSSILKSLLYLFEVIEATDDRPPGTETSQLRSFLEAQTELPPSSVGPCLEALKQAQWVLDVAATKPGRFDVATQLATAWPIVVPTEYLDVVYQHRPEALVVLAFYAAILHRQRRFWVFGGAGRVLIEMICSHVGPFWEEALIWPRSELLGETDGGYQD